MEEKNFYNPWGAGGYLWRATAFLAGIVLLVFLFSLINKDKNPNPDNPVADNRNMPDTSKIPDPYRGYRDVNPVEDWRDSIPGVAELPDPDDNYIPPVDSTHIVPDPEDSLRTIVCDQIIVFFNSQDLKADIESFAKQFKRAYPDDGYKVEYYNARVGSMCLQVPQDMLNTVLNEIHSKITGIDFYAATNEIIVESVIPMDEGFKNAYNDEYFRLIQAYEAWDITQGSDSVVVAIVDSYFDLTNPEIKDGYIDPINIPSQTKDVFPPAAAPSEETIESYSHGTHVTGCAIGRSGNGKGCSGIAPKCKWIPVSLCDRRSRVRGMNKLHCLEGILYAVYRGADVINCSFGSVFPDGVESLPVSDQVDYAKNANKRGEDLWEFIYKTANDHNSVVVKAAGNDNILQGLDAGNRSKNVITVEAVDSKGEKGYGINQAGQKEYFSNWSKVPEASLDYASVAAPGVKIWSCTDKRCVPIWKSIGYKATLDGFQEMDGTSMASPIVAGAVALLKSKNKNLTTEQIKKILLMTARQTDRVADHRIGPTIQIKDALEATSTGRAANFDELMRDHNLLVGKWKSTHELTLTGPDGNKTDEVWEYFIFSSPGAGTVEIHTIMGQQIYRAKLRVKWGTDKITITQLSDAVNSRGDKISKDDFLCTPDAERLMDVTASRGGQTSYQCKFEKVN